MSSRPRTTDTREGEPASPTRHTEPELAHPASSDSDSQVWRSLLAERMARSHDPPRASLPAERTPDAPRRERDPHLGRAAEPRRERDAQRQAQRALMDAQRETLRAAERTISLLREQIRLHDERARLSLASLAPSPPPANTPARTPTQRAALERSLSTRIANLQADIERERRRAGLSGPMRRPETQAAARARASHSVPTNAACPQALESPGSRQASLDGDHRGWLTCADVDVVGSALNDGMLEREWERQLANHEVDADGVELLNHHLERLDHRYPEISSSELGPRKVEGLGIQFALQPELVSVSTKPFISSWPTCLR